MRFCVLLFRFVLSRFQPEFLLCESEFPAQEYKMANLSRSGWSSRFMTSGSQCLYAFFLTFWYFGSSLPYTNVREDYINAGYVNSVFIWRVLLIKRYILKDVENIFRPRFRYRGVSWMSLWVLCYIAKLPQVDMRRATLVPLKYLTSAKFC